MERAPASRLFSINSFKADAGRWTTSPAAILFAKFSGKTRIRLAESIEILPGRGSDNP
jgi:hypothetical protein